jgi:aspartate carbamoyltransferase regulatory subunit
MNRYDEILSVSFIIIFLFIIIFIFGLLNTSKEIIEIEETYLSEEEILKIANTNLQVVRALSRGSEILESPRLVKEEDRKKIASLFPDYGPLYLMVIIPFT